MLQRDYFIRIIQEFMAALGKFLEKKEAEEQHDEHLRELYRQYVGTYEIVRNLSFEELLVYAQEQWKEEERLQRLEMTAELLYAEGCYKQAPLRQMLLEKAFLVFDYVDVHGTMFSIGRRQKMEAIRKEIHTLE
jgi:hypothetical protein